MLSRIDRLGRPAKTGMVAGGYLLATFAAWVAAVAYDARMAAMPYDTSGGMYAAGQSMSAVGTFLLVALAPTVLALWFLRSHRGTWLVLGGGALAFAGGGLAAMLVTSRVAGTPRDPATIATALFALLHMLAFPLWVLAFAVFAFMAPRSTGRKLLLAALGIEILVSLLAAIHWLFPRGLF